MISSVGSYSTLQHLQRVLHTSNSVHAFIQETEVILSHISLSIYTNNTVFLFLKKKLQLFSSCMLGAPRIVQAYYTILLQYKRAKSGGCFHSFYQGLDTKNKKAQGKLTFKPLQDSLVLPD